MEGKTIIIGVYYSFSGFSLCHHSSLKDMFCTGRPKLDILRTTMLYVKWWRYIVKWLIVRLIYRILEEHFGQKKMLALELLSYEHRFKLGSCWLVYVRLGGCNRWFTCMNRKVNCSLSRWAISNTSCLCLKNI